MIDSLITIIAVVVFTVMFLVAAWHKLSALTEFKVILIDYQILPAYLVDIAAILLPLAEIVIAILWMTTVEVAALASAMLLTVYCIAIGVNLGRGRAHISCGCTMGSEQPLSVFLIVRNGALIVLAVACLFPQIAREFVWIDYIAIVFSCLAIMLLSLAGSQLMANGAALASWRQDD